MFATLGGILLGLVVGVRHAFEPDHLAAVSTMVTDARGARRGALLGAVWG
ncbi:MAG: high-affinity nickel-transport family protein, partial [Kofleriaceae bacterium]